jgi:hypothetical protein
MTKIRNQTQKIPLIQNTKSGILEISPTIAQAELVLHSQFSKKYGSLK